MAKLRGRGPGTAGAADFEALMRRRRFTRCILRAQHAIESGADEDASAALDEARQLIPDAPEVVEFEARRTEPRNAVALSTVSRVPDDPPLVDDLPIVLERADTPDDLEEPEDLAYAPDPVEFVRSDLALVAQSGRRAKPLVAAGLAVVLVTLMAAGGGRAVVEIYEILNPRSLAGNSSQAIPHPADAQVSVGRAQALDLPGPRAEGEKASPQQGTPALQATPAPTRGASTAVNRPETDASRSEPRGRPSRLPSGKGTLQAVAPPAISRRASQADPPKMPAALVSTENRLVVPESMASAAPAVVPVATSGLNATLGLDSVPIQEAASRTTEEARRDEDAQIRAILGRYESAYNRLDASAASSVWPGVNRAALDRAFGGLLSQRISLGSCDIMKIGDRGLATCAGNAVWEPRVGGGTEHAQRYWAFDLRKIPEGWRIEHVRVR